MKTKRGFTILELLVASLLLGMLMTILTMIFNQSSIAWRTAKVVTDDMSMVRENIAGVRDEADNAFVWGTTAYRLTGLWDSSGELRQRACSVVKDGNKDDLTYLDSISNLRLDNWPTISVNSTKGSSANRINYTVNVKSAGPNGKWDDWDDVLSWPDEWD